MKTAEAAIKDIWMFSASIAAIGCILAAACLLYVLNFDLEISEKEKAGIGAIFVLFSGILAYNCKQALEIFMVHKNIVKVSAFDSSSNFKIDEACTIQSLRKHLGKSSVRRFSFPLTSHDEISYHWSKANFTTDKLASGSSRYLHNTYTKIPVLGNTNSTSFKDYDNIPAILHNSVKDLDSVIQHVKLLNYTFSKNVGDTAVLKENSETISQEKNLDSTSVEVEEVAKCKLESTKDLEVSSGTKHNYSLPEEQYQDLGNKENPIDRNPVKDLWEIMLLNQNTRNIYESSIAEFRPETFIINTKGTESFWMKIPSVIPKCFTAVNLISESKIGKRYLEIYKTKTRIRQDSIPSTLFNKYIPKLPMKRCNLKIPITQCMRETSKKRRVSIISRRELIISENEPTFRRYSRMTSKNFPSLLMKGPVISVDEILLSFNDSLSIYINDPSNSANVTLISKFEQTDLKHLVRVFYNINDYWGF